MRVKARLEEWSGRNMSFCDVVRFLCDVFEERWEEYLRLPSLDSRGLHITRREVSKLKRRAEKTTG